MLALWRGGGFCALGAGTPGVIGMPAFILLVIVVLVAVAFYLDNEPVDHEHQSDHKLRGKHTLHHRH
jgi:hypothetical protein